MNDDEKFIEELSKIVFPESLRPTQQTIKYRGFVLDKHIILENLLDLLLTAYFFGTIDGQKSELFRENVISKVDFAKKVSILQELKVIDNNTVSLCFAVNDYRLAQAHYKKNNPLRDPTEENWKKFQDCSTKAHAEIAKGLITIDQNLRSKAEALNKKKQEF